MGKERKGMTDTYEGGYKAAVLNINTFLENVERKHGTRLAKVLRSRKQYTAFVASLLNLLMTNPNERLKFQRYGGDIGFKLGPDGKIVSFIE